MDYLQLVLYLIAALVPSVCFIYVRAALFDKTTLRMKMAAGCVGCIALNRWFSFVYLLTTGSLPAGFNVGLLGLVGAFAFFLGANLKSDESSDTAKAVKAFDLLTVAYAVLYLAMTLFRLTGSGTLSCVMLVASIVVSGLIVPCMVRGVSTWKA